MTVLQFVTQKQMKDKTGFTKALGYSLPEEDKILIRKGLPKKLKHEVIEHEEEHILKGEEGPWLAAAFGIVKGFLAKKGMAKLAIGVGSKLLSSRAKAKAAKKSTKAGVKATEKAQAFTREGMARAVGGLARYRDAGLLASNAMLSLTGLGGGAPQGSPHAGGGGPRYGGRGGGMRPGQQGVTDEFRGGINPESYLSGMGGKRLGRGGGMMGRNYGGHIQGRALGGMMGQQQYNINESGPENVYGGGMMTRNPNPQVIAPAQGGYVQPNQPMPRGGMGKPMRGTTDIGSPPAGWDNGGFSGFNNITNDIADQQGGAGVMGEPPQGGYTPPQENPGGVEGGYNFMTDPGYEFRIGEGQRAMERGASAAGGLLSGGYGRRLTRYAQDYASNEYGNVYNRIAGIAGMGQQAAYQSGVFSMGGAGALGASANDAGYARATGYTARGNITGDAINDIGQAGQEYWGNRGGGLGGANNEPFRVSDNFGGGYNPLANSGSNYFLNSVPIKR